MIDMEIGDIREYTIEDRDIYNSASTTKGTQIKYKKDNYFYKLDKMGKEGFVEYLTTILLLHSELKPLTKPLFDGLKETFE